MALLINVYNDLVKEAEEAATKEVIAERVEVLSKYADLATELLNAEFPNDYNKDDVVALADKLIERDMVITAEQEKQAEAKELLGEYVQVSRDLLAQEYDKDFKEVDVEKLASTLYELDLEDEFAKEAQAIVEFAFLDELNKLAGTEFTTLAQVKELIKDANLYSELAANAPKTIMGKAKALGTAVVGKASANPKAAAGIVGGTALAAGVGAGRASKSGGDN